MADIFVSYAREDRELVDQLAAQFGQDGWSVWWDDRIGLGKPFDEIIERELTVASCAVVLWSEFSVSSRWTRNEARRAMKTAIIVPARIGDPEIPIEFSHLQTADLTGWTPHQDHRGFLQLSAAVTAKTGKRSPLGCQTKGASQLLAQLANVSKSGVAPRRRVFDLNHKLNDKVFAIELLTRPIVVERRGRRVRVTVDRRSVDWGVFTTDGKTRICEAVLWGERRQTAEDLDRDIHNLLVGRKGRKRIDIPCGEIPLRWVSGGVLTCVTWKHHGKKKKWTPFFFRDIPPYGWNIALGASEREDEVRNPINVVLREFLEETLILPGQPDSETPIRPRRILANPAPGSVMPAIPRANEFLNRHSQFRSVEDGIVILDQDVDQVLVGDITGFFQPTRVVLEIVNPAGRAEPLPNVLICFNFFELGIEVMQVLEYDLGKNDVILDGEIREPVGGEQELVRMPVGLISHDYLQEVFGTAKPAWTSEYLSIDEEKETQNDDRPRRVQPSIRVPRSPIPRKEIRVFDWDVNVRRHIARSGKAPNGVKVLPEERARHQRWVKHFDRFFTVSTGKPDPWLFFTPASAKAMSYYFAGLNKKNKSR